MATTFYLPSSGAAAISPSSHSGWTANGSAFGRYAAVTTRGSTAMTTKNSGNNSTALAQYCGFQWVYGPIDAVTISGDFTARVRGKATALSGLYMARVALWIAKPDATQRASLYSGETNFDLNLWTTSYANYSATVTPSSGSATAGDYLVFEVGAERDNYVDVDSFDISIGDTDASNYMYFTLAETISLVAAPTTLTYDFADSAQATLALNEASPTHSPTTDGTGTLTYSVNSGALPTGLSLNTSTGKITGTPTVIGTYSATIRVSNAVGTADATLSWRVTRIGGLGSLNIKL